MKDKRNGKHVNLRDLAHEILMERAKRLAEERGLDRFPGLPAYLMEASEFFERTRKRDV
jgi:hypothetical protein